MGELKNIDLDFKSKLFESFLKQSISKKNWGQFFTPIKVVRAINKMVGDLKEDMKICDPACGVGKFPLELVKSKLRDFFQINKGKIIQKIRIKGFDRGFDKEEQKTIILAKANMLIYFSDLIKENPQLTKEFSILFNNAFVLKTNSILGTLAEPIEDEYDLILTNPPYAVSGSSNLKLEINKSDLGNYYKISGLGVESLFIEWIVKALKPGGRGFIIVPDGILNRQEKKLRQFILDNCYIDAIISLPKNTFFTTPKKTYILAIIKKNDISEKQTSPVFTYLVSEIGESRDIYRFDIKQDDLTEAVELFSSFKGNWRKFQELNNDKKCKLQTIENFKLDKNWAVDRWWTKIEQTELGIVKEENIVSLSTFGEIIDEILNKLRKQNNLIKEISKKENKPSNFKEISLKNDKYFNLFIGKRVLKKEIINLNGTIPIYSANVKEPIGKHKKSIVSDFNNNFVLWGIDGDFEFNFIPKNQIFYPTDHCGVIRILNDNIFPEYLVLQLENVKHKFGFDRGLRASLENMKKISISVPFESASKIDVNKQKEVIEKYKKVKEIKTKIKKYEQKIDSLNIELSDLFDYQNNKFKDITIDKIFDLIIRTNDSKFTKKFINKHEGDIPVYGASKDKNATIGKVKNNLSGVKYFENCLTLNIIGSVGKVFYRKERFSLTGNAIPLIIKSVYKDWLDENYLKCILEDELRIQNFGIIYESVGKNKIRNIKLKIPMTSLGEFDVLKQRKIVDKYHKIEEIKKNIKAELKKTENIKVNIGI